MTVFIDPSQSKTNRKYSFIESSIFQNFLNFLQQDTLLRAEQGGAAPYKVIEKIKELKLGALRLPIELGGQGVSIEELFKIFIEIAQYDNDLPQILRSHFQFVEDVLRSHDSAFQARWIEEILKGKIIGNAFTEPVSQLAVGNGEYQTQLIQINDHFEVSGTKIFSTGTLYADYVSIRVSDEKNQAWSVIVPTDREGVNRIDDWDGIGQKFTASGTTQFTNVKVYFEEIHPIQAQQVKFKPFTQLLLHSVIAGIVKAAQKDAIRLLQKRERTFIFAAHETPQQDPLLLEKIGEISSIAYLVEHAVLTAAHAQDIAFQSTKNGVTDYQLSHQAALEASLVKVGIEPLALKAASLVFDITGASSTRIKYDLDRHWRNIRTLASHNPAQFKAYAIGQYYVNHQDLPNNVYF